MWVDMGRHGFFVKSFTEFPIREMLQPLCFVMNPLGGNTCAGQQILFPQTVRTHESQRSLLPSIGESIAAIRPADVPPQAAPDEDKTRRHIS
jgi:hypothetical protein